MVIQAGELYSCGTQPWRYERSRRAGGFSRILMNRESSKGGKRPAWTCWGLLTELTHEKEVCKRWK